MTGEMLGFAAVAVVLLAASLGVVLTPNLFHAVLYLAAALVATGVVFLLLDAPFLFGVQLLLYAGGVVTIVVFAIMLTERLVGTSIRQTSRFLINGALLSAAVFVGVVGFLVQMPPSGARGVARLGPLSSRMSARNLLRVRMSRRHAGRYPGCTRRATRASPRTNPCQAQ